MRIAILFACLVLLAASAIAQDRPPVLDVHLHAVAADQQGPPPGSIYLGFGGYRARLHSALTMEDVLVRHPRLRVYLMHAGYPMLDDLLAVLYAHPQVYVDVGVIVFTQPRAAFYRYLRGIMEAGFGKRVMFGSDQMVWPGVIERAVAVIEEAPFLRLSDEEIARHHGE